MKTHVGRATIATFLVFAINGLVFASWASRIPAVSTTLDIPPSSIGGLLLCMAAGSLVALPTAGRVIDRIGTAATVRVAAVVAGLAAAGIGLGLARESFVFTAVSLVFVGVGLGLWDVAQNIEGAAVEHRVRKTIMPQFHAGFSGGAILGALIGAALSAAGVPLPYHLYGVAALVLIAGLLIPAYFLKEEPLLQESSGEASGGGLAWKEARTLLIGVVVMGATLSEGGGNDWIAKATVDGLHVSESTGALVFAVFVTGMTVLRVFGGRLIDSFGRVKVIRVSMLVAALGLALFCLSPNLPLAIIGAALWGAGAALTFPLGMSAAADDPRRAAARVSVVATVGYVAFLAGPPALGFLADHLGMRPALLFIIVPILLATVLAGSTSPLKLKSTTSAQITK